MFKKKKQNNALCFKNIQNSVAEAKCEWYNALRLKTTSDKMLLYAKTFSKPVASLSSL